MAVLMLVLTVVAATPTAGSAHARLLASDPEPGAALVSMPLALSLTFSEAVDPDFSRAALVDSSGATVSSATVADGGDATVARFILADPAQPPGSYVLVWRVLSAVDGHVTTGALAFSAGTGVAPDIRSTASAGATSWPATLARWADLGAAMLLAGALAFVVVVAGGLEPGSSPAAAVRRWLGRIARGSLVIGVAGLLLTVVNMALLATGRSWGDRPGPGTLWDVLTGATAGRAMLARGLLLPVAALVAFAWARLPRPGLVYGGLAASVAALATFSIAGHAAAASDAVSGLANDLVHLAAAAFWTGGLLMLGLVTLDLLARTAEHARVAATLARLAHRFSVFALAAVGAVIATGVIASAARVSGPRNLTGETYGLTLIVKVLLVLLVLVVAGANLLFIVPRLRRAADAEDVPVALGQARRLRLSASIELGLAAAILVCAARLTMIAPADGPLVVDIAPRHLQVAASETVDDLRMYLAGAVADDPAGALTVTVADAVTSSAATDVARVIVLATAPDPTDPAAAPLAERFDLAAAGPGTWTLPQARLGFQAAWSLEVIVRRAGEPDVIASFTLDLAGTGQQPPSLVADAWRLPDFTLTSWVLLASAVVTVAGGLVLVRRLPGLEPATGAVFLLMILLIGGGFALSAWRFSPVPSSRAGLANPLDASDAAVVAQGEALWGARCASCHGVDGRGPDEEAVVSAHGHRSGPYDLTDAASRRPTDGDLFSAITDGVPGSTMPAYMLALTDEERWALVAWLRDLQRTAELNVGT